MQKRMIVIGGTAAGMSAASKAKRLDPAIDITVYERTLYVSYGSCGLPYYIGGMIQDKNDLIAMTPEEFIAKRGIDTFTRHEVVGIDREKREVRVCNLENGTYFNQAYDFLVLATGASPVVPPALETEREGVFTLRRVEDGEAIREYIQLAETVIILGGGFIGLEMAEQLTRAGLRIKLFEQNSRLLPSLTETDSHHVEDAIKRRGITLLTDTTITRIHREGRRIVAVTDNHAVKHKGELVLVCTGVRPNSRLAREAGLSLGLNEGIVVDSRMRTEDPSIWACGDCTVTKHLLTGRPTYCPLGDVANKQGRIAGANVAGEESVFPGVLGTQALKVFDLYLAVTGLTVSAAREAGYDAVSTEVVHSDRAPYYPGSADMRLTLVFDKQSGVILGAQGVGGEAVAGRINVLAAAITCSMKVDCLADLDLVYTPSLAPVYDPILIAAASAAKGLLPGDSRTA